MPKTKTETEAIQMSSDTDRGGDWDIGRNGELLVEEVMQSEGWNIIADRQFQNGNAPVFVSDDNRTVRPDLAAARGGRMYYIEVKVKPQGKHFQVNQNEFQHGIGLAKFEDYVAVKDDTGIGVWLVVYEPPTGLLLCSEVGTLDGHHSRKLRDGDEGRENYSEDFIFFNVELFEVAGSGLDTSDHFFGQTHLPGGTETRLSDILDGTIKDGDQSDFSEADWR